jgi:hypothetical protein
VAVAGFGIVVFAAGPAMGIVGLAVVGLGGSAVVPVGWSGAAWSIAVR